MATGRVVCAGCSRRALLGRARNVPRVEAAGGGRVAPPPLPPGPVRRPLLTPPRRRLHPRLHSLVLTPSLVITPQVFTDDFIVAGDCTEALYGLCESMYQPGMPH